jgi:hypothetical protein
MPGFDSGSIAPSTPPPGYGTTYGEGWHDGTPAGQQAYQQWTGMGKPAAQPSFPQTGNNQNTGASRQIGEFGGYPVGQVDVRTDNMKMLENAALPLILGLLSNPQGVAKMFGSIGGGAPRSFGNSPLSAALFGGSGAPTQAPQPQKVESRAMGGPLNTQAFTMVGEAGPEVIPPASMTGGIPQVIPLGFAGIPGRQPQVAPGPIDGKPPRKPKVPKVNMRAAGGPLDEDAFTIVGEQGPEFITPPIGGEQQVIPNITEAPASLPGTTEGAGFLPQTGGGGANPGFDLSTLFQQFLGGGSAIPTPGQFNMASGSNMGMLGNSLQNNPEMDAFSQIQGMLMGKGGMLRGNPGKQVMRMLQPLYQQNLNFGMNELLNRVPSARNSAAAIEGADLGARALNDYNLLSAQALQQGQQTQLAGMGLLGQLAGQAGNGQFNRQLQAGQLATQRDLGLGSLDLQAQQQQWNQTVNPTLQLLLSWLPQFTGFQTVAPGKK